MPNDNIFVAFYKLPVNGKSWGDQTDLLQVDAVAFYDLELSKPLDNFLLLALQSAVVFSSFRQRRTGGGAQEWHGAGSLREEFKYSNSVYCFAVDAINVVLNFKEVIMPTWWHKEGTKQMPRKTGGGNDRVPVMGERTMGCEILKMAVTK